MAAKEPQKRRLMNIKDPFIRARVANNTTRTQINNIPSKSHVIPLLPDGKCGRVSHLKNNAENVAQNQNFKHFAARFSVISLTRNELKLEIRLESMQQTQNRLKW